MNFFGGEKKKPGRATPNEVNSADAGMKKGEEVELKLEVSHWENSAQKVKKE